MYSEHNETTEMELFGYVVNNSKRLYCRDVVVMTTSRLHPIKPELRFCAGSNHTCDVSEIYDGEDL